ncbi:TPA: hypothetical protein N0F65_003937 [Lagenidium giganteum]|uniref:Uncharacterized protein n=1 Tax=Lagenidium giganteum TaxID=4803 RepID=A0AAV2Z8Z2_9STRA|nr:TPA: hypothetical protein N0F65_003937 [Lagenidium giganteum]
MKHHGYHIVKVGATPQSKLKKALNGGTITLSAKDLSGDQHLVVHPENAKKIIAAQKKGCGTRVAFMPGEIRHDLDYHSTKSGANVWSWIKDKAYPWLKVLIRASLVLLMRFVRNLEINLELALRLGTCSQGSQAAKDKMTALQAKQKSGDSFHL